MKVCTRCKEEKPLNRFSHHYQQPKHKPAWIYYEAICKDCTNKKYRSKAEPKYCTCGNRVYAWNLTDSCKDCYPILYKDKIKAKINENRRWRRFELKTRGKTEPGRDPKQELKRLMEWKAKNPELKKDENKRQSSKMNNNYIKKLLVGDSELSSKDIPYELIILKRAHLTLTRNFKTT